MIEKISLCVVNESGETVTLGESIIKIQSGLDVVIADIFTKININLQSIEDEEIKATEKFYFALNLKNFLKEQMENYAGNRTEN